MSSSSSTIFSASAAAGGGGGVSGGVSGGGSGGWSKGRPGQGQEAFTVSEAIPLDGPQSLSEMHDKLRHSGLRSSQLVIFIDCTKSNLTNGAKSYFGRSLHDVSDPSHPNPYQTTITIAGKTLAPFDADGLIPVFGFGDKHSMDVSVFPFHTDAKNFCAGFESVLEAYTSRIPKIALAGPTSFAPAIKKTMELVKSAKQREFTVCLIIADGQVNSVRDTEQAIVEASRLPISIIVVGVGDGPWDDMYRFDSSLPARKFDNFRFVEFTRMAKAAEERGMSLDTAFALSALAELPAQVQQAIKLRLL